MLVSNIENKKRHAALVTLQEAALYTGLELVLLRKLVRDGVLYGSAPHRGIGIVGNCDLDQAQELATRLQAARRLVAGEPITISAGAAKYGFSLRTVYNWVDSRWVRVTGRTESGDQLIDEGDIAYARALATIVGHRQGKALLPAKP